jgi:hypothetical protein
MTDPLALMFRGATLAFALASPAAAAAPDPEPLYGNEIVFSVWRKGDEIGQHRVTFATTNGALVVQSSLDLAVKILGITVYRYNYQSQESWRAGVLAALHSTVNDDGTTTHVDATATQGKLTITGPEGTAVADLPVLPSTHWDAQVITADHVVNTLSGKVDQIKLVPQGTETVPTNAGPRQATHYLWTGDIKAESWYDADGHWLKLRFPGKDGTLIDYVCVHCIATTP